MLYKLLNEYHTQRNNRIAPDSTCNVTAMVMALKATGIEFKTRKDMQPEDFLSTILDSKEAFRKRDTEFSWAAKVAPRQIHALLSWAVNEHFAVRPCTIFSQHVSLKEILYRVARHKAASVVSGRFTPAGHLVTVVGFESSGQDLSEALSPEAIDLSMVSKIIIDDPWGDIRTDYRNHDGNDIPLTLQEFNYYTREYNNSGKKWAHLFSKTGIF